MAIQRRYVLMPYLYTAFWKSSRTGISVARPLFFIDSSDLSLRGIDDAFLLGEDILIKAYTCPEKDNNWVLPKKYEWKQVYLLNETKEQSEDLPDIYQRSGTIIPIGPIIENTEKCGEGILTVLIYLDDNNEAQGQWYEDSGDGYEYQNGEFLLFQFNAKKENDNIVFQSKVIDGNMAIPERIVNVIITNTSQHQSIQLQKEFEITFTE